MQFLGTVQTAVITNSSFFQNFLRSSFRACSVVSDFFATTWTVACQAPLSMECSRQEYWSGLPFPTPGDVPNPEIETASLASPASADRFFYH